MWEGGVSTVLVATDAVADCIGYESRLCEDVVALEEQANCLDYVGDLSAGCLVCRNQAEHSDELRYGDVHLRGQVLFANQVSLGRVDVFHRQGWVFGEFRCRKTACVHS